MKAAYRPIFEPFGLPNGQTLRNRVIMAPMTHSASHPDGSVSDTELAYYARRISGASLVITAGTWVTPGGGLQGSPGADHDGQIAGLRRLASVIQSQGAKAVLQLFHGGRQSSRTGDYVSAGTVPLEAEGAPVPRELSADEIGGIVAAFGEAVRRAIEAGFDGVEIHGANGGLLQQFFSPHANRRTDRYGGTLERRATFALELIDEVKRVVRNYASQPFMIGYRISPEEPETPGITMADTLTLLDALARQGLDYLHISQKHFRSAPRRGVDDSRSRLQLIHEQVGHLVPIIGVGGIFTPDDALEALGTGIPLIALGRGLIMEPDWVRLVHESQETNIRAHLSRQNRDKLAVPETLWKLIWSIPGWFPESPDAACKD